MVEQRLVVNETGVVRRWSEGREEVRWDALSRVEIVTTDDGPFAEDFFWLLVGVDDSGVCVGGADAEAVSLLRILGERLPGLDHAAVIAACGSCTPARFVVWSNSRVVNQENQPTRSASAVGNGAGDGAGDVVGEASLWERLRTWWS